MEGDRYIMCVSSDMKSANIRFYSLIVSSFFLIMGVTCIIMKGLTVKYMYDEHVARDSLYLLPLGYTFLAICVLVLIVGSIRIRILIKRDYKKIHCEKS